MTIKNNDYIENLIRELISLPSETEWVEFKHNNSDPHMIRKGLKNWKRGCHVCWFQG